MIHINSSVTYFAAIAALIAGIPYVWHIRELLEEHFECEFLNWEIKEKLYKQADKLIAISDYVEKTYYEKYSLKTIRIYDGLNIKRYKKHIEITKNFNRTFIVPGAITPEKGQLDIVKASEILVARGFCDFKIIIVGNGSDDYVWALKKYIKRKKLDKNICILPYCDELSHLRNQAAYAITSSQNEALGRVTIEAMLSGKKAKAKVSDRQVVKGKDGSVQPPHQATKTIVEVDLHIHQLLDSLTGLTNADMLKAQLDEFNRVMKHYSKAKGQKIVFIHGKGEGVLRQALLKELKLKYKQCDVQDASFREYGFGATQVTIR